MRTHLTSEQRAQLAERLEHRMANQKSLTPEQRAEAKRLAHDLRKANELVERRKAVE